jgi:hypothetical protein
MLTIFTLPKAFEGHIGSIQRNALHSWGRLGADCEMIICGNEAGFRDVASEFGTSWIADVERSELGTPLLSSAFRCVEETARHDLLCYVNADIIFLPDWLEAVRRIASREQRFLLVGQTWDVDIGGELLPEQDGWEAALRRSVAATGTVRGPYWIDFCVFRRGTLGTLPDFAVGRPGWDNWMIWRARTLRIPVVDVSSSTLVIHQRHSYGHVREARGDSWEGPEGDTNLRLSGQGKEFSLLDATHRLDSGGLVRNRLSPRRWLRNELILHPSTVPVYRVLRRTQLWSQSLFSRAER